VAVVVVTTVGGTVGVGVVVVAGADSARQEQIF